jgi:hypothetical protein
MRKALVALAVLAIAMQLVPIDRTNPPVEEETPAPAPVRAILERSCYDCHSHETRWPWYAWVAPASWLVAYDVSEARDHLNFSAWNRVRPAKRAEKLEEVWEEVDHGHMPLWYYLLLHPGTRLSDADREALRAWALGAEE